MLNQIINAEKWYAAFALEKGPWMELKRVALWAHDDTDTWGLVNIGTEGLDNAECAVHNPGFLGYFHEAELTSDKKKELAQIAYERLMEKNKDLIDSNLIKAPEKPVAGKESGKVTLPIDFGDDGKE